MGFPRHGRRQQLKVHCISGQCRAVWAAFYGCLLIMQAAEGQHLPLFKEAEIGASRGLGRQPSPFSTACCEQGYSGQPYLSLASVPASVSLAPPLTRVLDNVAWTWSPQMLARWRKCEPGPSPKLSSSPLTQVEKTKVGGTQPPPCCLPFRSSEPGLEQQCFAKLCPSLTPEEP